jgi:NAD(P)H dehydrogenase (quinone)
MPKVLIVYYSRSGNTEKMARIVAEAIQEEGVSVACQKVADTKVDDLLEADGIVMGSPTYYGTMAAELKKLIDDSVQHHGKLDGKVGGAFSSSGCLGGGNETTVLDLLHTLLIHGLIVQGDPFSAHYGAVSLGAPDDETSITACRRLGQRVARLVQRLHGCCP